MLVCHYRITSDVTKRTHCKRGHALTDDNVYVKPAYPKSRGCLACIRRRDSERNVLKRKPPREFARTIPAPCADDLHWAAGLFEGEGTVTIAKSGGVKRPTLTRTRVIIGNTDREVVDFFAERWGGRIRPRPPSSERARPSFEWALGGAAAAFFLRDVQPFLRTQRVREKFAVVLRAEEVRRADPFYARDELHEAMCRIRALNRRGV